MITMFKAVTNSSSSSKDDGNDGNLEDRFKEGKPSDRELDELAGKIHTMWERLGLHLGISQHVLDEVEANERDKPYRQLLLWRNTAASTTLYHDLYHALCHPRVGLNKVAEEFCFVSAEEPSTAKRIKLEVENTFHALRQMLHDADQVHKKTNLSDDLIKIASGKGFIISENPASGNCMFYALSEQLERVRGIKISHQELRETLVKFLRETPNLPDGTELFNFVYGYPTWSDYLRSMEKDGTWGDHLILCATANYYQTHVRIVSSLDREQIIQPDGPVLNSDPLVLGHIHEFHFVSLLPRQEFNASTFTKGLIPTIISARGPKAQAAYVRALEEGRTHDKRVKVLLIGQDRVGKTSLGKSLKGEPFNKEEPSTEGVEMNSPIKNVGTQAWKNPPSHQKTTAFDHKCAKLIARDVKDRPAEQETSERSQEPVVNVNDNVPKVEKKANLPKQTATPAQDKPIKRNSEVHEQKEPDQIATLVEENLSDEGIWPVMWDFAGQAVYRAIHPIFMSPEAIYLLVIDLTKELSDLADSLVKVDGHKDGKVESPDSEDTNLDHILRWISLVHFLKQSVENVPSSPETPLNKKPPHKSVIMVGAKADMVQGDPREKMKSLLKKISSKTPPFQLSHITEDVFVVDNTRAGESSEQEITRLRERIIDLANKMPHTEQEIPLQWLSVEQEIARHPKRYVSKTEFRHEISEKCCTLKDDEELEVLLLFLHFRGTIIYHELPKNPDGLVVLDPKWLIETITEIITAKPKFTYPREYECHYEKLKGEGVLSKELLDLACDKLNIDGIRDSLIFIMKKFNLMFEWKTVDGKLIYLVPCMLKKHKDIDQDTCNGPAPLYLRFDEGGYVPSGLFTRLVVLFGVWASEQCTAEQPELCSNAAFFFVGENYKIHLVCYSSVIQVYVSIKDASDQVDTNFFCRNILRKLDESWKELKLECQWLTSIRLNLCARCELCSTSGCGSTPCGRHGKQECSHDDCAHYLDLKKKPLACRKKRSWVSQNFEKKCKPGIEVLETVKFQEHPGTSNKDQRSTLKRKRTPLSCSSDEASNDITPMSEKSEGPSDNDQHSPVKRREPLPSSSSRLKYLKHISVKSKHPEGSSVKRREESPSCSSTGRLKLRPDHRAGTSNKDQRSTVKRKRKSLSCSRGEASNNIGVMSEKPEGISSKDQRSTVKRKRKSRSSASDEASTDIGVMSEKPEPEVAIKDGRPKDDVLEGLALKIPLHWKTLGRRLKIKEAVLDAIHKQEVECSEKAYKMLLKWKAGGKRATFLVLYDALCHDYVNRKDLAEEFCCVGHNQ